MFVYRLGPNGKLILRALRPAHSPAELLPVLTFLEMLLSSPQRRKLHVLIDARINIGLSDVDFDVISAMVSFKRKMANALDFHVHRVSVVILSSAMAALARFVAPSGAFVTTSLAEAKLFLQQHPSV